LTEAKGILGEAGVKLATDDSVKAEEQRLVTLGKELLLQKGSKQLQEEYAVFQAKQNLSQLDFMLYLAGLEDKKLDEKKAKEEQDLKDLQEIQKAIAEGTVGGINLEDLRTRGFSEANIDFAQKARDEALLFKTTLETEQGHLNDLKTKEEEAYNELYKNISDGQTNLEDSLTTSYNNIIVGLQGVASQAKTTAEALNNVTQGEVAPTTGGAGFAKGGFTGIGNKSDVAGWVHKGEWVAPKWMVAGFKPMFAFLEGMRQNKKGFADGGYTSPANNYSQPITINPTLNSPLDWRSMSNYLAWKLRTS
jgi:hypothetical protein